jgi:hypothetical protein
MGLCLIHFLKGHNALRPIGLVCKPPQVFEFIRKTLELDRSVRGNDESDPASVLAAQVLPQPLGERNPSVGGDRSFDGHRGIVIDLKQSGTFSHYARTSAFTNLI